MTTAIAATHSGQRAGFFETSSMTVASADGPARAGTASGTMNGSPPGDVPYTPIGSRAYVRLELPAEPIGQQAYRRVRQLLLSKLDV